MSNNVWNEMEREFVEKNAGLITDKEGAKQLSSMTGRNITVHSYRKQRQKLGLKKNPGRGVCSLSRNMATSTIDSIDDTNTNKSETDKHVLSIESGNGAEE
jgi:hypothetical protein